MENTPKQLVITRTFNAPLDLVWKAWSVKEQFAKWWGPKGFDLEAKEFDFRPGGRFHYSMTAGENVMWGLFVYEDITEPNTIIFVSSFSDPEGNVVQPDFSDTFPLRIKNIFKFEEHDGKTTLTLTGGPVDGTPEGQAFYEGMFDSMNQGFKGTFDKLDELVSRV